MAYLDNTLLNDIQDNKVGDARRPDRLGILQAVKAGEDRMDEYISNSVREQLRTISSQRKAKFPVIKD